MKYGSAINLISVDSYTIGTLLGDTPSHGTVQSSTETMDWSVCELNAAAL